MKIITLRVSDKEANELCFSENKKRKADILFNAEIVSLKEEIEEPIDTLPHN